MDILKLLKSKVIPPDDASYVVSLVIEGLASDVESVFIKGLSRVKKVVLAKAFTKYGWVLAIYGAIGMTYKDLLLIYYNLENPRWTASALIHEAVHIGLGISRADTLDLINDETLAYVASFKSGMLDLYINSINYAVSTLSNCVKAYDEYDLSNIVVPRLIAHKLTNYEFKELLKLVDTDKASLIKLWLRSEPSTHELRALATALKLAGLKIKELQKYACREVKESLGIAEYDFRYEGVDSSFLRMIKVLDKAAEDKERARKVLEPWWDELEDLKDLVDTYLDLRSGRLDMLKKILKDLRTNN